MEKDNERLRKSLLDLIRESLESYSITQAEADANNEHWEANIADLTAHVDTLVASITSHEDTIAKAQDDIANADAIIASAESTPQQVEAATQAKADAEDSKKDAEAAKAEATGSKANAEDQLKTYQDEKAAFDTAVGDGKITVEPTGTSVAILLTRNQKIAIEKHKAMLTSMRKEAEHHKTELESIPVEERPEGWEAEVESLEDTIDQIQNKLQEFKADEAKFAAASPEADESGYTYAEDQDGDGTADGDDDDIDGDGVANAGDAFPMDPDESVDTDGDGIGDNADTDDDGDGYTDAEEAAMGTNPLDSEDAPDQLSSAIRFAKAAASHIKGAHDEASLRTEQVFLDKDAELRRVEAELRQAFDQNKAASETAIAKADKDLEEKRSTAQFDVFDGVVGPQAGGSFTNRIEALNLDADVTTALLDLMISSESTTKEKYEKFYQDLEAFIESTGNTSADEEVAANLKAEQLDTIKKDVEDATEFNSAVRDEVVSKLENTIKTLQKVVDVRGVDMYTDPTYSITPAQYLEEKAKLKKAETDGDITEAEWLAGMQLLSERLHGNNVNFGDTVRRLGIWSSINYSQLSAMANPVQKVVGGLESMKRRIEKYIAETTKFKAETQKELRQVQEELVADQASLAEATAKYDQDKAAAEATLGAAEADLKAKNKAYKEADPSGNISEAFEAFIGAYVVHLRAQVALKKVIIDFIVVKALLDSSISTRSQAIPQYQDAIASAESYIAEASNEKNKVESAIAENGIDLDPSEGLIGGRIELLETMDSHWVSGETIDEGYVWSLGHNHFHSTSFIPNTQGELVDLDAIVRIKKAYIAAMS